MSKRLLLYVEGQTEELFVNRILRNHLLPFGVNVERPILAITRPGPEERRGGFVNWSAVEADLRALFGTRPDPDLRFTTFLDVYALPTQTPGYPGASTGHRTAAEVAAMEAAWNAHSSESRFLCNLQRHEFETLLLAPPTALDVVFPQHRATLQSVIHPTAAQTNAEDINDGPTTHPSARLAQAMPEYPDRKASYALFTLLEAGLDQIRPRCPRFDSWLAQWEQWGQHA